jgi:hypothetical protein
VDGGCGTGLGENDADVAGAKAPMASAASKKSTNPGSKTRGRPKKIKLEGNADEAAREEREDEFSLPNTVVKEEAMVDRAMCGSHGAPEATTAPKTPEPQCKRIKLENAAAGEASWKGRRDTASEQKLGVQGPFMNTGVPCAIVGPRAAEGSQEYQGYYSCEEDPSFDFGEYVHQDGQEGQGVLDGQV